MSVAAPAWLSLCALGIVVFLLHVRRHRSRTVPSIQLWRQLEIGGASRQWLRLPSLSVLLLLQTLVVVFCALALARPFFDGGRFTHEIIVLDGSGSMRSTDTAASRFDTAVTDLMRLAAGPIQDSGARMSAILAGARPQLLAARLANPQSAVPGLAQLRAGDGAADWDAVARLIGTVRKPDETTRLTLITDSPGGATARLGVLLPGVPIETRIIPAAPANNAGLKRVSLRPLDIDAGKWRAEGTVVFSAGARAGTTVTAFVKPDNSPGFLPWGTVEVRRESSDTGTAGIVRQTFALDLDLRAGAALVVRLPEDDGPHDNTAQFIVHPKPRALRVLQLGKSSEPLVRALRAAADVELYAADAMPADTVSFDLAVVNDVEVPAAPQTNVLWLGSARIAKEGAAPLVEVAYPGGWIADHPLTESISGISIATGPVYRFARLQGSRWLFESGGIPAIQARTTSAGREVRLAFDLDRSGWPEQPSFPVFIANVVRWTMPNLGRSVEPVCRVGHSCVVDPRLIGANAELVSVGANLADSGGVDAAAAPAPADTRYYLAQGFDEPFIPDRTGLYRLKRGSLEQYVAVNQVADDDSGSASLDAAPRSNLSDRPPPAWWLLLIILAILIAEGTMAGIGSERFLMPSALKRGNPLASRRRILLGLRLTALLLVVLALAGLPILIPNRTENVVVVAGPDLRGGQQTSALLGRIQAAAAAQPNAASTSLGLVAAEGRPRLIAEPDAPAADVTWPKDLQSPTGANLEDALALAAAALPADAPGRLVVGFDGNETRGNATRALPQLLNRNVRLDVLPATNLTPGEVLVERVVSPDRIYAGDTFPLVATIYSGAPASVALRIFKNGEPIAEQTLAVLAGRNRVETIVPKATAGRARYEVSVASPADTFPQNNRNGVTIDVLPAPDVLIVASQTEWADRVAKALDVHEIRTKIVEPKRAPYYLKDWLAYSAIVLMNVPAIELTTQQQELIERAVADHGRGLLVLGGENAFGPGGYYETPLERVSPLSSRVPRDAPRVALAFVLDRSGSMQRNEGGATRLDIAKQATLSAIRLLHEESQIAIVAFDSEAKVLLPLGLAKDSAAVARALAELEPGGGTAIYPGLVEALQQLEGVDAVAKHMVVMSDGLSQPGDFPGILKKISEQGISVSTVAIGEGAEGAVLQEIARMGKGAFHATQDFKALPSILSQEALLLSGKPVEERTAVPIWLDRNVELFSGLPDMLPAVHGYVLTTGKREAKVHVAVTDEKEERVPLLASWRYGNGRVLALATHGAGAWTRDWQELAEYPLLLSQIVRQVLPSSDPYGLHPRLVRHGDEVDVLVEATDQEGVPRAGSKVSASLVAPNAEPTDVALTETSTGRYQGQATLEGAGEFALRVNAEGNDAELPVHVGYPALFDFPRADTERLTILAAITGGRILSHDDQIFGDRSWRWSTRAGWPAWLLLALALFMVELIVRYASGLRGDRRPST